MVVCARTGIRGYLSVCKGDTTLVKGDLLDRRIRL